MRRTLILFLCLSGVQLTIAQTPFVSRETELAVGNDVLYGTFLEPEKAASTIVLFIAGSGPTDRDGNSAAGLKTDCTKKLAEALAAKGIASVRYDKRGVAKSSKAAKSEAALRFEDYVKDAVSWIQWIQAEKKFKKIIVAGHSEGSLIGMLAAKETNASAFISLAGTGRAADVVIMDQLSKNPNNPEQVKQEAAQGFASLKQGKTVDQIPPYLMSLFRPSVQPYMISWLKYDPAKEIAALKIPVLIVQGTTDLQVSVTDAQLLKQARPDAQLKLIEGMNHIFCDATPDVAANMATYTKPELPLHKELVPVVNDFISKVK